MSYNELIKNFDNTRDYMRDFFVYGFRSRNDFDKKSARSYDNERRRIESWLSEYMSFRQDEKGKNIFFSVDSRDVKHNPLYKAYKAKSFTDKDIILHFYIMDYLSDGEMKSVKDIAGAVYDEYLGFFETDIYPDESTIRNKLKEYSALGLLKQEKVGKEMLYGRMELPENLDKLYDVVSFASEYDPAGVIGSIILDKYDEHNDYFSFKHHYLLNALEQEILIQLLFARSEKRYVHIEFKSERENRIFKMFPLKIYVSTQNGRQYLMAYEYSARKPKLFRLDRLLSVKIMDEEPEWELYDSYADKFAAHLWSVSEGFKKDRSLDHVEMIIYFGKGEEYIIQRLKREKRGGSVELIDDNHVRFQADVYDIQEMFPWMRTFIGRIEKLESNNKEAIELFYDDIKRMQNMYGGEDNDL